MFVCTEICTLLLSIVVSLPQSLQSKRERNGNRKLLCRFARSRERERMRDYHQKAEEPQANRRELDDLGI
jgi:hypothetical protein